MHHTRQQSTVLLHTITLLALLWGLNPTTVQAGILHRKNPTPATTVIQPAEIATPEETPSTVPAGLTEISPPASAEAVAPASSVEPTVVTPAKPSKRELKAQKQLEKQSKKEAKKQADSLAKETLTPTETQQPTALVTPEATETRKPLAPVAPPAPEKVVDITSDKLVYEDALKAYVATGNVSVIVSEENTELRALKMTYIPEKQLLIAEQNVEMIKDGQPTYGTFARIDLSRQCALITQPNAKLGVVRMTGTTGLVSKDYIEFNQGKLLINRSALTDGLGGGNKRTISFVGGDPARGIVVRSGFVPHLLNTKRVFEFVDDDSKLDAKVLETQTLIKAYAKYDKLLDPTADALDREDDNFKLSVKKVEIIQHADQYQTIDLKSPRVTYKNKKVFALPGIDLGQDQTTSRIDYLGPDFGYNRDLGGAYLSPGFDFKVGRGALKLSPMLTYGDGIKRNGDTLETKQGAVGAGVLALYNSQNLSLLAGRTSANNYNVFRAKYKLPIQGVSLLASQNTISGTNYLVQERPSYSFQAQHSHWFGKDKLFGGILYNGVGLFKDDFFPFNSQARFIQPPRPSNPYTAGRWMTQVVMRNQRPLIKIGNFAEIGAAAQFSNALYTTGDNLTVLRAGPTLNLFYKNVFMSQTDYSVGRIGGNSPFVFDSFFLGKQTVTTNNALRLGPYAMLGARQVFNIQKENVNERSVVGNMVYATVGPKHLKFTLGYDALYKLTYWGLSFYPSAGETEISYDKARIFRPVTAATKSSNGNTASTIPAMEEPTNNGFSPLQITDPVNQPRPF
ncbi:MAG: hypothetical protein NTW61_08060 [Candidatus Melainabacteria bacterium]|nr:hypothetical protein [Candidatus Melainabacteria bacterium]